MSWSPLVRRTGWLVVSAAMVATCASQTPPEVPPAERQHTPRAGADGREEESPMRYSGPDVSVDLRPLEGGSEVIVRVTFSTGGWRLTGDEERVAEGVGIVRLTFVRPARDQIVTQMLVDEQWRWQSPEALSEVEVWVNIVRRGDPQDAPEYRLAARYPAQSQPLP